MDVELAAGEDGVAVGADGVEGDEAEIEQPGIADDHVEADRQDQVDQHVVGGAHVVERHPRREDGEERERADQDGDGPQATERRPDEWRSGSRH